MFLFQRSKSYLEHLIATTSSLKLYSGMKGRQQKVSLIICKVVVNFPINMFYFPKCYKCYPLSFLEKKEENTEGNASDNDNSTTVGACS